MFTYREERRLFAILSLIIVAALVALIQVVTARNGTMSPLSAVVDSVGAIFEATIGAATIATRGAMQSVGRTPHLMRENGQLRTQNQRLERENVQLREALAAAAQQQKLAPVLSADSRAVPARIIGFPPENEVQSVTINRGARDGIRRDDGVINGDGVVGRIAEVTPFVSKIVLITDYTSSVPAMIEGGRWWGVAKGNVTSVRMEYLAQDAPIHVGDHVITGEARSFHSGELIGTIERIERTPTGLYQTAIVRPAADLNSLDRVAVIPK
ncbi:MAG: rod shape-determining protein MreC [Candidatus Eremiobacteraeota bacterium]|nr:rod shape-determining protein MreC [Candidatus Eremiobacteraeota bacterium]